MHRFNYGILSFNTKIKMLTTFFVDNFLCNFSLNKVRIALHIVLIRICLADYIRK
jgi:hypothetical protein